MRDDVVEVGPGAIRGCCDVPEDMASAALEGIDDDIAFLDDQPVAVPALWRAVFRAVLPEPVDTAVLVCPTWWPSARIECIREAAITRASNVVVLDRADVVTEGVPGTPTVIEIAADFVIVSRDGCVVAAAPRLGERADVAGSVLDEIGMTTAVLVDAPVGVPGAAELAAAIVERLRANRVVVTTLHPDRVLAARQHPSTPRTAAFASTGRRVPRTALALVVSVAFICVGLAAYSGSSESEPTEVPMTLLVEGRVAVKVPAQWAVRRVTSGPGSARVQVTAPDNATAVLVTQSRVRKGEALSTTAAMLRDVLDDQRAGVFGGFNPDDRRADRPTATYQEHRDGRQIDWAVFVDVDVRIGIGCQSASGEERAVRYACDEAIRSAHALI